jgi:hypothetical protein
MFRTDTGETTTKTITVTVTDLDDEAPTNIQINDADTDINGFVTPIVVMFRLVLSSLPLTISKSALSVVKVRALVVVSVSGSVALRVPITKVLIKTLLSKL